MSGKSRMMLAISGGGMAGLWVAYHLLPQLWSLGALAGAGVGGFVWALPELPGKILIAWRSIRVAESDDSMEDWRRRANHAVIGAFAMAGGIVMAMAIGMGFALNGSHFSLLSIFMLCLVLSIIAALDAFWWLDDGNQSYKNVRFYSYYASREGAAISNYRRAYRRSLIPFSIPWVLWDLSHPIGWFLKTLFFLVYSRELAVCSMYAGLVVLIVYPIARAFEWDIGIALAAGGLLGIALGVANYEIISKRMLHLR